nr:ROK family transcriptional regulator [uncultured Pseudomonas sp.]
MIKHRSLTAAIEKLEAGTKAARVRALLPEIEERLSAGVRISDLVQALNDNGLPISVATLKSYLYRSRKVKKEQHSDAAVSILAIERSNAFSDVRLSAADGRVASARLSHAVTTPGLLRHINTARCLRLLRTGESLSRAELARALRLTRATIGNAVRELIDRGLVTETVDRAGEGRLGRPGAGVTLNPSGAYSVGIDISSHSLTGVLVDLGMNVVHKVFIPVGQALRDAAKAVEEIARIPEQLIVACGVDPKRICGVCVSVPGLVDQSGHVVVAPFLQWRDVPLHQMLSGHPRMPWSVAVSNDANAFASAELSIVHERDAQNMLLILLTEGMGGAVVHNGAIFGGGHGYAGELGHMVMGVKLDASSERSFERLAGYERFHAFLSSDVSYEEGLAVLATTGHPDAARLELALDEWAEVLATGVLNLVYLLNPVKIVFGGPLSVLFPRIRAKVEMLLSQHLLHGFHVPLLQVTRFGADGAAIGAASVVRNQLFSLPHLEVS